jgi:hypothetical protein
MKQKLIGSSISAFRNHFNPIHFTDEKIIDSLIWGFVSLAKQGAIADGKIQYTNESIIVRTLARCLLSHAACKRLEIQTAGS